MRKKEAVQIWSEIVSWRNVLHWYERIDGNFYYYYLKIREFLTGKPSFVHFVYNTNTTCTLRCKECHSHMPYFAKESHYITDFENFKRNIDKLLKSVDLISSFRLQGGETLLVKDLAKIVEYACSKKQIQHIQIISNGTIIPSQELLNSMRNSKVVLWLSDYSANAEVLQKSKHDDIIKLCQANNVKYKHQKSFGGDFWYAKATITNELVVNKELSIKNLQACFCSGFPKVFHYQDGKIYLCPSAIYYAYTNPNFKMPLDEMIDIINTDVKTTTKKIKKIIDKRIYDLCARCDVAKNVNIRHTPGEQIKG